MKKDAGYYEDQQARGKEDRLDEMAREQDWLAIMEREAEACNQCIIELKKIRKPTKAIDAFELKVIAERLAHEASKLQNTFEKKL